jgi:tetratricopeptide (TPR) repeat protein/transglutaminase-like putative cysteine protease
LLYHPIESAIQSCRRDLPLSTFHLKTFCFHDMNDVLMSHLRFVLVAALFLPLFASAQVTDTPKLTPRPHTTDLSQQAAVFERFAENLAFENDGTSVEERTVRIKVQSAAGIDDFGLLRFGYPQANSSLEIVYVRVLKADGTTVETPAATAQDMPSDVSRVAPMYSDLREKHIAVRGLAPGDTIEYQLRIRTTAPLVPGHFWYAYNFSHELPIKSEELTVSVPADRSIQVKTPTLQPVVATANGRRTYAWKWSFLGPAPKHDDDLAWAQQVVLGRLPAADVELTTFKSWDEFGQWFSALLKDRTTVTPEIRAKVAELIRSAKTDDEKIAAIYGFVATQFRYIAVSFGIGRMQPHTAAEVFANGYGDCKDKHTLLATMLAAAGIEARPALINAQHAIDAGVPSPGQFDHMLTYVPRPGGALWLDSTAETAPAGVLMPVLRDKPALVLGPTGVQLLNTPLRSAVPNRESFDGDATLAADGHLHATVRWQRRSDHEIILRGVFRSVPRANWDELVQRVSYLNGFSGKVTDVKYSAMDDLSHPLELTYTYDRDDYGRYSSGVTSPFLPRIQLPDLSKNTSGKMDVYLGEAEIVFHSKLALPTGATPFAPPGTDLERPFAAYHSTYTLVNGVLEATRKLTIKQPMVPADQYDDLIAFIKSVNDDQDTEMPMRGYQRSSFPLGGAVGIMASRELRAATTNVPAAREAYEKGLSEAESRQWGLALDDFQRALQLDPKMKGAWSAIAYTRLAQNESDEAFVAFRKEIEINPDYPWPYKSLAFALMGLHRNEEAIEVWEQFKKVAPEDRDLADNLGSLYYRSKRYADAEAEYKLAVDRNPGNRDALMGYGMSALRAGHNDLGMATLKKVVDLDPSPLVLNDVAFELADSNLMLDDALAWALKSIQQQERVTREIDIDNLHNNDVGAIDLLGATWDTVGWVYFRRGGLAKAESYVKAAWSLAQRSDIAEHLAEIYAKEGKTVDAGHMRRLAMASKQTEPGNEPSAPVLLRRGPPSRNDANDAALTEISKTRLTTLPSFTPKYSAEVFLLFGPDGRVQAIKYINPEDEMPEATTALKAAHYNNVSFPQGSDARLLRRAVVACGRDSGCSVTLVPPSAVRSLN